MSRIQEKKHLRRLHDPLTPQAHSSPDTRFTGRARGHVSPYFTEMCLLSCCTAPITRNTWHQGIEQTHPRVTVLMFLGQGQQ